MKGAVCGTCGKWKPLNRINFAEWAERADGVHLECIVCQKKARRLAGRSESAINRGHSYADPKVHERGSGGGLDYARKAGRHDVETDYYRRCKRFHTRDILDMTEAELQALEREHGCPVKRPWVRRRHPMHGGITCEVGR